MCWSCSSVVRQTNKFQAHHDSIISYLHEQYISSSFCQGSGHGFSNASRAARDQGSLPFEREKIQHRAHIGIRSIKNS